MMLFPWWMLFPRWAVEAGNPAPFGPKGQCPGSTRRLLTVYRFCSLIAGKCRITALADADDPFCSRLRRVICEATEMQRCRTLPL